MRFLVDESAGRSVADYLADQRHDVVSVVAEMVAADDETILRRAVDEQRIVVTNDKDFGELVFRSGYPHAGIVLFRLKDEGAANRVQVLDWLMVNYAERLSNHFTVITEHTIRIRATRPSSPESETSTPT